MASRWRSWHRRTHRAVVEYLRSSASSCTQHNGSIDVNAHMATNMPLLSAAYGRIIHAKRQREMANAQRISPPSIPVISVGNFTFGATGKTPCVLFLTEYLLRHTKGECVPMLLTRGYGDDEWRMFASRFPSCKLAVGADRLTIGKSQVARFGSQLSCVLLDDGLQQWKLQKDLEIIMIDALAPFGNGKLIPHGSMRELPEDAISRADIVLLHHANLVQEPQQLSNILSAVNKYIDPSKQTIVAKSQMAVVAMPTLDEYQHGSRKPGPQTDTAGSMWERFQNKTAVVFCGVGNPQSVELVVRAMSCWARVEIESFPDHHAFSASDLDDVAKRAAALVSSDVDTTFTRPNDVVFVTTEKDVARSGQLIRKVLGQSSGIDNQVHMHLHVLVSEFELLGSEGVAVLNRVKNTVTTKSSL